MSEFDIGDEVYYTPKIFGGLGSYAQQHVADVDQVARKPHNINHLEAASLTLVGGTVWEALVTRAQLTVHCACACASRFAPAGHASRGMR